MMNQRAFWPIILTLMLAESVSALEVTMIYAALARLIGAFGDPAAVGWLITAFMLSSAAGAALCGRLGDLFGRRRVLLCVLAAATLGSVVSALTRDLAWIITGRTLQGASGAILPLCYGLVRERVAPERVALGVSLLSATATICAGAGLVLGGLIVDLADWPMIFHICALLGIVAFIAVFAILAPGAVRSVRGKAGDLLGGLLFAPAVLGVLLAIVYGGRWGWADQRTLVLLGGGLLVFALWVWRELTAREPLLNVRLFARREIAIANLVFAFTALGVMQGGHFIALLGQQDPATGAGLGLSATAAATLLLPANIVGALTSPSVVKLLPWVGARGVLIIGAALMTSSYAALAFSLSDLPLTVALLALQGVGLGLVFAATPLVIVAAAPADRTSEATGMLSVVRATAMGVGAQTVAVILAASMSAGQPSAEGFRHVALFISAAAACALIAALFLPQGKAAQRAPGAIPASHR